MSDDRDFEGQTVRVNYGGYDVTTSICEHGLPAIECPHCDVFGGGYWIEDKSPWSERLKHPIGWIKLRWWIFKNIPRSKKK